MAKQRRPRFVCQNFPGPDVSGFQLSVSMVYIGALHKPLCAERISNIFTLLVLMFHKAQTVLCNQLVLDQHVKNLFICILTDRDLKETAQAVPYTPDAAAPPLIRAIKRNGFPQPVVRVRKLDPGKYMHITLHVSTHCNRYTHAP